MTIDTFDDLPNWIRPGARLAVIGSGWSLITVTKITRTQIVAVSDRYSNTVNRFDRKPVPATSGA